MGAKAHAVDYVQPGALSIPRSYLYLPDHVESFTPMDMEDWLHALLHLLSFIPVGFLIVLARRPPVRPVPATLIAAVLAVVLAGGKFLFHARHTSVADIVVQVAGALLGALLASRGTGTCCTVRADNGEAPAASGPAPARRNQRRVVLPMTARVSQNHTRSVAGHISAGSGPGGHVWKRNHSDRRLRSALAAVAVRAGWTASSACSCCRTPVRAGGAGGAGGPLDGGGLRPGRVFGFTVVLPLLWLGSLARAGGYDRRLVGVGSEEFRKILNAAVSLTAGIAIVSYAAKLDLAAPAPNNL